MGDGPGILQMIVCLRDGNLTRKEPQAQAEAVEQLKASYPSPEEATRKNVALPQFTSGLTGEFKLALQHRASAPSQHLLSAAA